MKFLHISDLHFGKTLCEYSLLEDQEHWCRQLLAHLEASSYDALVIAGDLYDRSVPGADAVALCDWFFGELAGRLHLPVLCIAGNHDSPARLNFGSSLYSSAGLYMAALPAAVLRPVTLTDSYGPVDFFLLPYLSPGDGKTLFPDCGVKTYSDAYRVLLEQNAPLLAPVPGRRRVLVAHGFFGAGQAEEAQKELLLSDSEVSLGGSDLVDAGLLAGFDYCALGHLHACQTVGSPRLRYSGSPLKYSVSEEKQKKCALAVELDAQGNVTAEPVTFPPLRDVRTVRGTLEELLAPTAGGFSSQDYVQLTVLSQGTEIGAAEKLRNVYPHYLQIRYQNPLQGVFQLGERSGLAQLSLSQAYEKFYQQVTGQPLEEGARELLEALANQGAPEEGGPQL